MLGLKLNHVSKRGHWKQNSQYMHYLTFVSTYIDNICITHVLSYTNDFWTNPYEDMSIVVALMLFHTGDLQIEGNPPATDRNASQRGSNVGVLAFLHCPAVHLSKQGGPRTLCYYYGMTLSQEFEPMGAQLCLKAALPLGEMITITSDRCSKTACHKDADSFVWEKKSMFMP